MQPSIAADPVPGNDYFASIGEEAQWERTNEMMNQVVALVAAQHGQAACARETRASGLAGLAGALAVVSEACGASLSCEQTSMRRGPTGQTDTQAGARPPAGGACSRWPRGTVCTVSSSRGASR